MRDLFAFIGRELLGVFHETADGGAVFEYTDRMNWSSRRSPIEAVHSRRSQ